MLAVFGEWRLEWKTCEPAAARGAYRKSSSPQSGNCECNKAKTRPSGHDEVSPSKRQLKMVTQKRSLRTTN
jgi:hypothetical protein